jgi:hypothetical protein
MIYNRFCSFSGEDFAVEKHEYVTTGKKEYLSCQDHSHNFKVETDFYRRLVGFGYNYSLIAYTRKYDQVFFFCLRK